MNKPVPPIVTFKVVLMDGTVERVRANMYNYDGPKLEFSRDGSHIAGFNSWSHFVIVDDGPAT